MLEACPRGNGPSTGRRTCLRPSGSSTGGAWSATRRTLLGAGGSVVIDDDRPARCVLPSQAAVSFVSVRIPRRLVPLPQGEVARLTASPLALGEPISALCGTIARASTERTTVGGWIRHRRLERCRKEMLDPAHRQCPIAAIAVRWGFASAAHFSRAFRDAYGVAPRDYRLGARA
ncbi:MAG: helix-turn-helix domain-containing protein [Streptosporangiales bacterium]|nr:helix-turn-helix domain-containing protein [Streptosporangiales bacterium]